MVTVEMTAKTMGAFINYKNISLIGESEEGTILNGFGLKDEDIVTFGTSSDETFNNNQGALLKTLH